VEAGNSAAQSRQLQICVCPKKKRPDERPAWEKHRVELRLFASVTAAAAVAAIATATIATAIAAVATTPAATATAITATATTATSAATATSEAATFAAATEPATGRTLFTWTRDVHRKRPAFYFVAVELFDCLLGFVAIGHRDEGKTAGTTGEFVEDDLNDADGANLAKQGFEILGGAGEGKVPHVELAVI
jgi:hypothetical protein